MGGEINFQPHVTEERVPYRCSEDMRAACDSLEQVERRMEDKMQAELKVGRERMDRIEATLNSSRADISEVLDILRLGKSFFKILGYIGAFVKWIALIGAPVVAFWYTIKSGGK